MPWSIWVLLGLVLLAMELLTPGGFFIAFFGVAALLVGLLTALGIIGPVWLQWILFSALSIVSVLLFRKPLLEWMKRRSPPSVAVDTLVGEMAFLTEDLAPGAIGKAELRGASWSVRSREGRALRKGERCRVQQVDGLTLWVQGE